MPGEPQPQPLPSAIASSSATRPAVSSSGAGHVERRAARCRRSTGTTSDDAEQRERADERAEPEGRVRGRALSAIRPLIG